MNINRGLIRDGLTWGLLLWLFGYILGIIFFMMIPPALLGWVIMPFGIAMTLWVLFKKIKDNSIIYLFQLAFIWTIIAIVFDYFFLVKVFKPTDGYYKLDVYLYYIITFILPIGVGIWKNKK
ncbi:MAG: hypothetical protein WCO06_01025 [Candidatus Roizmanbacteria bacterium]